MSQPPVQPVQVPVPPPPSGAPTPPVSQEKVDVLAQVHADASDRTELGQRRINLIWELTQAAIAVSVVLAAVITAVVLVTRNDPESRQQGLALLTAAFFLVIGQYFTRTNHTKTGGPGGGDVQRDR